MKARYGNRRPVGSNVGIISVEENTYKRWDDGLVWGKSWGLIAW